MHLNPDGIFIGIAAFLLIGAFHPIVIRCEYHFSKKIWPVFLLGGILSLIGALFASGTPAALLGVLGCTCLWSIKELFDQEKRVEKGWFPRNPRRKQ